jgi:hypothetical protein
MKRLAAAVTTVISITTFLIACSDSVEKPDTCGSNPGKKGCKKSDSTSSTANQMTGPAVAPPLPVAPPTVPPDAGRPDAGASRPKPTVPPINAACIDLSRCCGQVRDTIEKASCVAIASQQQASLCANAMIAYQVFGGCGHSGSVIPDIFNPDRSLNSAKDCTYLKRACMQDPTACDAAYRCNGASPGGTNPGGSSDPCASAADQECCRYPNTFDCGGGMGSTPPVDPCDSQPDPWCCKYPNTFECGGFDPCASAADPNCCRNPNSFDCGGFDPCASAPDPECCRNPNSFDCGGSDGCDSAPDPYCCRNPQYYECGGGL